MTPAQARRLCLTTAQRLDRLHQLAVAHMFRAEAGTEARRVRTERQVQIARQISWAAEQEAGWSA